MGTNQDKLRAALDFIRKTGAKQIQVRVDDNEYPHIWFVVALYENKGAEVDASLDPWSAALRLCERLGDGGQCTHCGKPTGFEPELLVTMPMSDTICWYQFDPGSKKYVRGCG